MTSYDLPKFLFFIRNELSNLPDLRRQQGRRYRQDAMLMLLVLGFLRGLTTVKGILERFSFDDDILAYLGFKRTPSQGTYTQLFKKLPMQEVNNVLMKVGVQLGFASEHFAVDGKTIKGSLHKDKRMHVLNIATPKGVLLSHGESALGGGEIKAALKQLKNLDIEGKTITGDAMFAQRELCKLIEKKEDFGSLN